MKKQASDVMISLAAKGKPPMRFPVSQALYRRLLREAKSWKVSPGSALRLGLDLYFRKEPEARDCLRERYREAGKATDEKIHRSIFRSCLAVLSQERTKKRPPIK